LIGTKIGDLEWPRTA